MPLKLERQLMTSAAKKGLSGSRAKAYVYGTLRKTGWAPSTQRKRKRINKFSIMKKK